MSWNILKQTLSALTLIGAMAIQAASAAPIIHAIVTPGSVQANTNYGVDIAISGVTDLYAYQFSLNFDPATAQGQAGSEGPFLAQGGPTFFDGGTADNTGGTIAFVFDTLISTVPGVSGSGILVHFDFLALTAGAPEFRLSDVLFLDSSLNEIGVTVGATERIPEPASIALLALGLAGMGAIRRRRN